MKIWTLDCVPFVNLVNIKYLLIQTYNMTISPLFYTNQFFSFVYFIYYINWLIFLFYFNLDKNIYQSFLLLFLLPSPCLFPCQILVLNVLDCVMKSNKFFFFILLFLHLSSLLFLSFKLSFFLFLIPFLKYFKLLICLLYQFI